jgi:hypothetical protein
VASFGCRADTVKLSALKIFSRRVATVSVTFAGRCWRTSDRPRFSSPRTPRTDSVRYRSTTLVRGTSSVQSTPAAPSNQCHHAAEGEICDDIVYVRSQLIGLVLGPENGRLPFDTMC